MADPGLLAYAAKKRNQVASGGITVNVGTVDAPINVEASTDVDALVLLQGAFLVGQANPSQSFQWVQSTGVSVTLTAAQITTMFVAVTAFVQATFVTLGAVLAAINAGTVTTVDQIDGFASPAWPVNS